MFHTSRAQCTDYLAIRGHLRLFASTGASHYRFALNWSLILPQGDLSNVNTEALRYKYTNIYFSIPSDHKQKKFSPI